MYKMILVLKYGFNKCVYVDKHAINLVVQVQ